MQLQAQEEQEHNRRIAAQHVQQQRAPDQAGRPAPPDPAAGRGSRQRREGPAHGNHRSVADASEATMLCEGHLARSTAAGVAQVTMVPSQQA